MARWRRGLDQLISNNSVFSAEGWQGGGGGEGGWELSLKSTCTILCLVGGGEGGGSGIRLDQLSSVKGGGGGGAGGGGGGGGTRKGEGRLTDE